MTSRKKQKDQKKQNKRKNRANRPILFVTYGFVLLFLGMMYFIGTYNYDNQQQMLNNSFNKRAQVLIKQNIRGTIYSANGKALAKTTTDEDGVETREYPYQNLFSHVVGYASNGRAGIEALGNYYLINSNAPISQKVVNESQGLKYPGDDIYTTLDIDLQQIAYDSLGVYKGAVVVSNPKTGAIYAMVSKPDFDPNTIEQNWDAYVADKSSTVLLNRVTQGLYPPGSTFKIITTLEYIRENPDSYDRYHFSCNGSFAIGNDRINCYHGQNHGSVNLAKSFAKSCNSSFANIGVGLDKQKWAETLDKLMFNQELPLELNYSKSMVSMSQATSDADTLQTSIGQGSTGMSPMHLNMITQAIANDGVLMKPYIIARVENASGSVIKQFNPSNAKKLMTKEEADILRKLMIGVVENGTATKLDGLSYTAAGKTGSAEYGSVKGESHAWFTGFAPADDPEICVTIIIEGAGSGGDYAVPIAKRIFDVYFGTY